MAASRSYYQPVVNLEDGKISSCEALLRWRHPERGMISPAEFIPVAEETGLINQLGHWVLNTACARLRTGRTMSASRSTSRRCSSRARRWRSTWPRHWPPRALPPSRLELEITEAVLIRDDEVALDMLHQLRKLGVRIALDDFGTGYSSLSYLQRFPFDKIKIDRSFIKDLAGAGASSSIVQAVVNIAAASDMTTTAEGVETEQQRNLLLHPRLHRDAGISVQPGDISRGNTAAVDVAPRQGSIRGLKRRAQLAIHEAQ